MLTDLYVASLKIIQMKILRNVSISLRLIAIKCQTVKGQKKNENETKKDIGIEKKMAYVSLAVNLRSRAKQDVKSA